MMVPARVATGGRSGLQDCGHLSGSVSPGIKPEATFTPTGIPARQDPDGPSSRFRWGGGPGLQDLLGVSGPGW